MDYRLNMDPKVWGPPAWLFLDAVTQSFPVTAMLQDQLWMIDFLTALGDALPCERCRVNYKKWVQMNPIGNYVGGRQQVQNWIQTYKKWSTHR